MTFLRTASRALFPLAGALALAACGDSEDATYETNVVDESGGELIVTDPEAEAVDVELPETPMTPVPADEEAAAEAAPTPAPE